MKIISSKKIIDTISELCVEANTLLKKDILNILKDAYKKEKNLRSKNILKAIIDNANFAKKEKLAICQDTGMPVVFLQIGQDIKIDGDLKKAINKGIELGYKKGSLRNSIINDPILRKPPSKYTPCVIHFDVVKGNNLKITVLPKGFGCENKTQMEMFNPTTDIREIKKFIIDVIKNAGPDACPPFVVGIGIGGTQDYASFLAKKALLRPINKRNKLSHIARLEKELFSKINKLNIGPMGLGGKESTLAVNIETYPTHIAGLPVVVNISCHAMRAATKIL
ncbi:MAG: fumarate hydratase [Candidatus Omnitrophota bacterium]